MNHEHNSLCEGCVKFTSGLYAELATAKQINALNGESIKEGRKENARLRRALENIVLILGPTIPDCCEGGRAEMGGALDIASEALKQ